MNKPNIEESRELDSDRRAKRQAEIDRAVDAIDKISFHAWPNQDLRSVVFTILDALRYDYDDPRQTVMTSEAVSSLSIHLAKAVAREHQERRKIAARVTYELGGPLQVEGPENPDTSLWASIKELERRRVGGPHA